MSKHEEQKRGNTYSGHRDDLSLLTLGHDTAGEMKAERIHKHSTGVRGNNTHTYTHTVHPDNNEPEMGTQSKTEMGKGA